MSEKLERELEWDDIIEDDGLDFILLPEGDYDFEVVGFERARYNGGAKLPPCNQAIVSIKIDSPEGTAIIRHNLFLHTITEGLLCNFFTGIGQRKKGEKLTMNWNKVVGSKGKAKIGIKKWINSSGEEKTFNEIKRFYEPTESPDKGFEAGRF